MKKQMIVGLIIACMVLLPFSAMAGVKLKISDDTSVDLGFRVQAFFKNTENGDDKQDFDVRRVRLRLGGKVTKWMSFFIQTEKGSGTGGSGYDMRIIDAWVSFNFCKMAKLYMGEHMAPAARQVLTSSGGLMAISRPGVNNYNLTWGLGGRQEFNTANYGRGNLTLGGTTAVRDQGITLFGSDSFSDSFHFKYYLGIYDGIDETGEDNERFTARLQFNLGDPEPGYFNLSTYVGKKKTIAFGISYDTQDEIAADGSGTLVDYEYLSFDVFVEQPIGDGTLTCEAGFNDLDLDDAGIISGVEATQTQGDGFYVQTGYFIPSLKLQPWAGYEEWSSDGVSDHGSWDAWKVGVTYFVKGHNANVKLGYESFNPEVDSDDEIDTLFLGFYITY